MSVPLLEAIGATLIGRVNGDKQVALKDVFRGAFMKHWDEKTISTLYYRPSCSNCEDIAQDDESLARACKSGVARVLMAQTTTYPAIEGVHTLLEEFVHETGQRRSVAVVMRMKTRKRLSAGDMRLWALSAHRHAKEQLKLNDGEYYVALYVSKSLSRVRGWESCMPKGTIVIERTSLKGLLIPFGIAPLLSTMDSNTDN